MRRTKIIATMGPAVASYETILELIENGMDVARLNFSHGSYDSHAQFVDWIRRASDQARRPVAVFQDIQGPKIRVGTFAEGSVRLDRDSEVRIVPGGREGAEGVVPIDYEFLLEDVEEGQPIMLADGQIRLEVTSVEADSLLARVLIGGELSDHKGVAFPLTSLRVPAVTEKDKLDLEFGRSLDLDYVAASFVRTAADIEEVKERCGGLPIIAKIELAKAYENLDEILSVADAAMVARGDLGVQLPLQKIPFIQRDIIHRSNMEGRISITATEMLESMITTARPTRAEVTDIVNAVANGTDAVMLSGETAVGKYPVKAVDYMGRICLEAEEAIDVAEDPVEFLQSHKTFASATAMAAVEAARNLDLETIVAFTETGSTARLLSKYRPEAQIVAFTAEEHILRRMALYWGVQPEMFERRDVTDLMIATAEKFLEKNGICEPGEGVVMVAGTPPNQQASTNLMKLHRIGDRAVKGRSTR